MAEDSLEPLVTQCPTCRTRFRVTEVQLGIAGGRVRCGACLSVFTGADNLVPGSGPRLPPGESADAALDALLDELRNEPAPPPRAPAKPNVAEVAREPVPPIAPIPTPIAPIPAPIPPIPAPLPPIPAPMAEAQPEAGHEPAGAEADLEANKSDIDVDEIAADDDTADEIDPTAVATPPAPKPKPERAVAVAEPETVKAAGVPVKPAAKSRPAAPPIRPARAALDLAVDPDELLVVPPRRRRWVSPLLVLCIVGLGAEALYLQFDEWAKNPQIRPVYEWLCPYLNCRLPEMRALDKMVSKNLVVRANPDVAGELLVDAIIVNEATFAQAFPDIELRFSSLDGDLVMAQRYRPNEYLAGELKGVKKIAPLTPVHIALDIKDPGQKAVNYVMVFSQSD